jgi:hypothetical protein
MLDIQCCPDIDPGPKQFVDILPTLGMAATGHVRVCILIDEQNSGFRASAASRSNSRII